MPNSLKEKIKIKTAEIETILSSYLPEETGYQKTVITAMNYTMKAGGKRLRPMLMDETFRLFGGTDRRLVEPFMAALEMIHTYSLIHDDLPALDDDDTRRGKPTAHVVYGEAMAILAGDALLNYAFETAAKAFRGDEQDVVTAKALRILAQKPGIYGMIGGQVADVESEGKPIRSEKLDFIHENKTAALIECAMMIGAVLAGAEKEQTAVIENVAKGVGLAFQIQDDILDRISTSEELGKPVGSDVKNQKNTYVTMHGLHEAEEAVINYTRDAIEAYDSLRLSNPFLRELLLDLTNRRK